MGLEKNIIKDICLNEIKNEWLASKSTFPDFLIPISKETQIQNEQYIQSVSEGFEKHLNRFSRKLIGRKKWKQKTLTMINNILYTETIIGAHCYVDEKTFALFQDEIKDFLRHVRKFSPELSIEGIGQALRNYIVFVMFNEFNGMKHGFNYACFGYSMLYPFTDNYIDSEEFCDEEKKEYNQLIRDKIEGKEVHCRTGFQQKTCQLLQAIESEYPREKDSTIFTLLLMMLEAQEDSLRQQKKDILLTNEERLNISLYKGGISVLIDRFFIKKEVTHEDLIFYLGFGFFLQLADDLQDIKEDRLQGHQTIFTEAFNCNQEEIIVNKLLHFVHHITNSYHAKNAAFKNFILTNCFQLIYSSVAGSKEFFSKEYMDQLELYFPVTYSFLDNIKANQITNKDFEVQKNYMKILDEIIF